MINKTFNQLFQYIQIYSGTTVNCFQSWPLHSRSRIIVLSSLVVEIPTEVCSWILQHVRIKMAFKAVTASNFEGYIYGKYSVHCQCVSCLKATDQVTFDQLLGCVIPYTIKPLLGSPLEIGKAVSGCKDSAGPQRMSHLTAKLLLMSISSNRLNASKGKFP